MKFAFFSVCRVGAEARLSVCEQTNHFNKWLKSLRKPMNAEYDEDGK